MLKIWTTVLFLLGEQVCFDRLGCFSDDIPWAGTIERPIAKLPWSPERINARFLLYTKINPNYYQEITATDPTTIDYSNFNASKITRFITHGFIDQGEETWLSDMCRVWMFQVEDVNCICIDWKSSSRCQYTQASNNVRVVGAEIAYFIDVLMYSPSKVHIIGHSLGAHVAGEAGRRRPGIARITGLDPAEPYFQGTPIEVRLDKSDATFVDIIHTDSAPMIPYLGFGMRQAIGHMDFYPNGGENMPGCKKNPLLLPGTRDFVACNHLRSYKYYSDSILFPDGFLGYPCASYEIFETESCFPCPQYGCPNMGHYADKYKGSLGSQFQKFFLNTGEAKNFTRKPLLLICLLINRGTLKPGNTYTDFIDAANNIQNVTMVKFLWNNNILNPTLPRLGAEKVTVQEGENGKVFNFCGTETVRENVLQTLTSC
uniref:Triacylglycerol lipase n=1 Tax=Crocodylus porosus TaxID=8502 RepID=A0A7M4EW05_CROPO